MLIDARVFPLPSTSKLSYKQKSNISRSSPRANQQTYITLRAKTSIPNPGRLPVAQTDSTTIRKACNNVPDGRDPGLLPSRRNGVVRSESLSVAGSRARPVSLDDHEILNVCTQSTFIQAAHYGTHLSLRINDIRHRRPQIPYRRLRLIKRIHRIPHYIIIARRELSLPDHILPEPAHHRIIPPVGEMDHDSHRA